MADELPPASDETVDIDRPWRVWATVSVVAIAVIAAVVGFVVLRLGDQDDLSTALAVAFGGSCRADSTDEYDWPWAEASIPPTEVAWTVAAVNALKDGDAEAGATVAGQLCASCHGPDGVAPSPAFPSLAGQSAEATYKQLRDFASGHRVSPIMAGMAQALDEQQMIDIAQFYADQERPEAEIGVGEGLGDIEELALNGDPARGLPSCDSCHTQRGPQGTPLIDGLPATYIAAQLQAFANGTRANDIYGLMRSVAGLLTADEITQLADYYGI